MLSRKTRVSSKGQSIIPRKVRRVREKSPFAKYRGIGNPEVHSGRKAIVEYVRELRSR